MSMDSKYVKINNMNNTNVFVSLEYVKKIIKGILEDQNIKGDQNIQFDNGEDGLQITVEISYSKKMISLKDSIVNIHNMITSSLEENLKLNTLNVIVLCNFNSGKV